MTAIDLSRLPQPIVADHPQWVALYHKAWELAARSVRQGRRGQPYMDAAWDRQRNLQWVWDTCFMCMYCRYAPDQFPGVQSLDNFYDLQRDDGYISMTYDMERGEEPWPDRINPPLFAWAEWEHYRSTGDDSRLARAAGHIERLMTWIDQHRRTLPHRRRAALDGPEGGVGQSQATYQLYYFDDGGSSGMDDSPRSPRLHDAGQYFDWIDLSSQMAHSFALLGQMHEALGHPQQAQAWKSRAAQVGALVNAELWCERTRFYHDRMLPTNFMPSKTAAGFWPILAGFCPESRLDDLAGHLLDEKQFNRPLPVPSLSSDDPNYDPAGTYWVGGVWAPTNYMIARGLMLTGRGDLAHGIACRYLDGMAGTFADCTPHTLWECYSPEANKPGLAAYTQERVKPDFVGWSGLGPIAMLIENVLGIDVDVPHGRVDWTLRLTGEHGLRNLSLGKLGAMNLLCQPRASGDAPARIEAHCRSDITLAVHRGTAHRQLDLRAGQTIKLDV